MIPGFKPRQYRYKGGTSGTEQKNFWIILILTIVICLAIVSLF